jgi:hypothetical protein
MLDKKWSIKAFFILILIINSKSCNLFYKFQNSNGEFGNLKSYLKHFG